IMIALSPNSANPHPGVADITFSKADCEANLTLTYNVTDVLAADSAEVWVTTEGVCTDATARSGASQVCYQLPSQSRPTIGATTFDLTIGPNEIADAGIAGLSACEDTATSRKIKVYVLLNNTGAEVTEFETIDLVIDFVGPAAPTITSIGANDATSVNVEFTAVDGSGAVEFFAYCEQAGVATSPTSGAGGAATSVTSAGGSTSMSQGWKALGGVGSGGTGGAGGAGGAGGTGG